MQIDGKGVSSWWIRRDYDVVRSWRGYGVTRLKEIWRKWTRSGGWWLHCEVWVALTSHPFLPPPKWRKCFCISTFPLLPIETMLQSATFNLCTDNNLYSAAVVQPLPYGEFAWHESDEIESLDETGYRNRLTLPRRQNPICFPLTAHNTGTLQHTMYDYVHNFTKVLWSCDAFMYMLLTTSAHKCIPHYRSYKFYLSLGVECVSKRKRDWNRLSI